MFPLAASVLVVALASAANLGTPLRQDGYTLRPPEGFRMARMDLFHGTRAGAVALDASSERFLSAALTDRDGPDAATLMVAVVGESFRATPSARDSFATAAVKHFSEELGLPLSLNRSELVAGGAPRVQVLGTLKQQGQIRTVVIAAMEGEGRHAVITFSAPTARFEALWPAVEASLGSFRADAPAGTSIPTTALGTLVAALGLGLFASWTLWKRRRRLRRAELGLP